MKSKYINLQNDCLNENLSLSELLRKVRFVAKKNNAQEMAELCTKELEGYSNPDSIPKYREVLVEYKVNNPIRGWIPIEIPDSLSEICRRRVPISIAEMERSLNNEGTIMWMSVPAENQKQLCKWIGLPSPLEIKSFFPKNQFIRIISTVRNKISDWVVDLDEKEILDEECEFTKEEKEQNLSITNIFNAPVNVANNVRNMTNSFATINNNNNFDFEALKQLITKIEADLENAKSIEADKTDSLKEQITLLKKSVEEQNKSSAMDILQQLAIGASSSGIWSIGSTITTFLSSLPPFT